MPTAVMAKLLRRLRFGKLEALLAIAVAGLILQLFPAATQMLMWMVDVRNWPRTVWFWLNIAIVLVLFAVRCGPGLIGDWRARRDRLLVERQIKERQTAQREHREMVARLKAGRRRRLY